jgi:hypothetical protein
LAGVALPVASIAESAALTPRAERFSTRDTYELPVFQFWASASFARNKFIFDLFSVP